MRNWGGMRHWELSAMPAVNLSHETKGFTIGGKHTEKIPSNLGHKLERNGNRNLPSPPAETSVLAWQSTLTQNHKWITQQGQSLMGLQ